MPLFDRRRGDRMKNAAKTSPVTQKRHNANGRKGTSTLQQKINSKIQEHEKFGTQDEKEGYIIDFISGHSVRATPEETEAVQPFSRILVDDYGYPKTHIHTRPQYTVKARPSDKRKEYPVDIAIFTGEEHNDDNAYIIVECKKKNRKDGRSQLEDYLRFSKAYLGVWYNGKEALYLRKHEKDGKVIFVELPNIPIYGQRVEDVGLFKRRDLKKTHNLKAIFGNIRNYLAANNTGITLDNELVVQIINIIFCKIYDERFTRSSDIVNFRAGIDESSCDIAKRIKCIFDAVKSKYPDVFNKKDNISLTDTSIAHVTGELQQYCLTESERDVIADAFEVFISPSLRGGQGQFFTPRNVVRLLVALVNPTRTDKLIDPACGSGGFLIESLRHVWTQVRAEGESLGWPEREIFADQQEVAIKNFRGIDKESFLSKTTKAYMAILGDGRGGIFCENSLLKTSDWDRATQIAIQLGSFDVILTNPPYGSKLKIDDAAILSLYDLGFKWECKEGCFQKTTRQLDDQTPQVLFIERCLDLLKPGGRLGIVAPESMFCNPSHRYIVNYVQSKAQVEAVISMPENLFQPHTHAKTCVALLRKLHEGEVIDQNNMIFMAVAKWCGHDSRGLEIPFDDIPAIQERFVKFRNGEKLEYDHLGFTVKQANIIDNIYLPIYYNPEIKAHLKSLQAKYDLISVAELAEEGLVSISNGDEVGKLSYGTGNIPFVRTSDIANWEIKLDPKQGLSEDVYESLRIKQDVQVNDILMVKDGTYLVGTCAMITKGDTKIVYQSHLWKIRSLDHNRLSPYLLLALLSSPIVKEQIRSKQFTQDIIDTIGKRVYELVLPFPKDKNKANAIIAQVKKVFDKRSEAKDLMRNVLLNVTPIHDFDGESAFMTLV